MPRKAETEPAVLQARLERKRAFARERTRQYRSRIKERVDSVLTAAVGELGASVGPATLDSPAISPAAKRTARAILRRCLTRHGVTLDRVVREIRQALDATKFRRVGNEMVSQKDWLATLRAADQSLKLLERSGDIPGSKEGQAPQSLTIHITRFSLPEPHTVPLVPVRTIEAPDSPPARSEPVYASSRDEARQKASSPYEYELPEAAMTVEEGEN